MHISHLKCDEQRPYCLRCTASGRICEGYPVTPRFIDSVAQSLNDEERRAFVHFQTRTVYRIFGEKDGLSWIQVLLQLGHAESVVKHGIVALASLHESVEAENSIAFVLASQKQTSNAAQILALKHYNKAIQHIRTEAFDAFRRPDVVLILCILFMCFEQLRNNDTACTTHLTAGLKLLVSWRERTNSYTKLPGFSRPTLELMNNKITPTLERLRVQFALCMDMRHAFRNFGQPSCLPLPNIPTAYDTLENARRDFDRAMNYIFSALEYCSATGISLKENLFTILERWKKALDSSTALGTPLHACAHNLLSLYFHISTIVIGTHETDSEIVFDAFAPQFETIAELGTELVQHWKVTNHQHSLLFSFDLGITPAMFFVASRCRHPRIRRIARDTMLQSPMYRGLWPDWYSGLCANRIIEIEEHGFDSTADDIFIPESRRIRKFSADLDQEHEQILMHYVRWPFDKDTVASAAVIDLRQ